MPKLKLLSSTEIISILKDFGFTKNSQTGSHIKLVRENDYQKQILIIPNHKELKKGTIKAILNQAGRFVSIDDLRSKFYTE